MDAYYNEYDPYAAQYLRNLIDAGHIAPGVVDERSIVDVQPNELMGYTQCHFFAGIGIWSHALRQAGWADDRPIWTGSCPCQPFSAAGKGQGFDDERHLWPHFYRLISECRPSTVLGEQVASKNAEPWIDLVQAELEAVDYAFGCLAFPAAGVGAPHIRDRAYWVAYTNQHRRSARIEGSAAMGQGETAESDRCLGGLADTKNERHERPWPAWKRRVGLENVCDVGGMDNTISDRRGTRRDDDGRHDGQQLNAAGDTSDRPGPVNGYWSDADWIYCRDGKWRPVSPKPQPLVDGSAESLGRVCASAVEKIEEEINAWSMENKIDGSAAMRNLREHLGTQSHACWSAGRLPGLHEAPFLLAFMRQLAGQGWRFTERAPVSCAQAIEVELRVLRRDGESPSAPRKHGLAGQQTGERANAVHFLSSLLARHAHSAWDHAYSTYAEIGFPLYLGPRSRVGRLRAYGNGLNAEAAKTFIEIVKEALCAKYT